MTPDERRAENDRIAHSYLRDTLKEAIKEAFDESHAVTEHMEHHEWMRSRILKDKARTEFWLELRKKTYPKIIWGLVSAGGLWAWGFVAAHWKWTTP